MNARRALLYIPGDDARKIAKASTLEVDCICLDMEDGVALNRKLEARQRIAQALVEQDFGRAERLVRINPTGSGLELADLAEVLPAHPDGIVIPKLEDPEQVRWVSSQISMAGYGVEQVALICMVETARGIVNLASIASADPRLQALIFGAEDLAGDIGAVRTPAAWEVFYARSAVVTHAAAFGLQAIDMVYADFQDEAGLRREAHQGVEMGFGGKQVIHPSQIGPVQEEFTPSDAELAHALRVVEAAAAQQAVGKGAFALDGKMVDAPVVKAAERILGRARAAGKI
ncbi:MAG TPA: CoA ester lyase [Anaerolineales bacterium]|nr:CoA ester lyase [Anaerolineales bacterium]